MKIAVVGAGAIGGFVGAKLALAGEDVTFMVRGANLDAIRASGFRLVMHDGTEQVARDVKASNDYAATGAQDVVILATKAHQLDAVAESVPKLLGPATSVVTMQNGVPYWYFHRHGGPLAGTRVRSVDPTGVIGENIPAERVIGCVVYPATELVAPGQRAASASRRRRADGTANCRSTSPGACVRAAARWTSTSAVRRPPAASKTACARLKRTIGS